MSNETKPYMLELSYEMVDKITVDNLTEMKAILQEENSKLLLSTNSETGLLPCQKEDFEYTAAMIFHITEVINYFSKP